MKATTRNPITRAAAILATAVALVAGLGVSAAHADGVTPFTSATPLWASGIQRLAGNQHAQLVLHHDWIGLHANDDGRLLWRSPGMGSNTWLSLGAPYGLRLHGDGYMSWSIGTWEATSLEMNGCGFELLNAAGNVVHSVSRSCAAVPEKTSVRHFDGSCIPLDRWGRVARGAQARMLTTPYGEVGIWTNDASNRKVWSSGTQGRGARLCTWANGEAVIYDANWQALSYLSSRHNAVYQIEMEGCGAVMRSPAGHRAEVLGNLSCDFGSSYAAGYSRSQAFGNEDFAAGYSFGVGIDQTAGVSNLGSMTRAYAYGNTYVTALEREVTILGLNAEAISTREDNEATATLTVMGDDIEGRLAIEDKQLITLPKTFFTKSKTFVVGVPIVVTASVSGEIGMTGHARPGAAGFNVGVRPYANLTASIAAGVGVACVSAGIEGTLTLIEVGVPTSANVMVDMNNDATVHLTSEIELQSLSGTVGLYASYCVGKAELEIGSWDGVEASLPLFDDTIHL